MIYYSSLITVQHSPSNHIGTKDSPVYIEDLRLEGRVGGVLLVSNGYAALDNKAGWMGKNGCTGNVNMHINGLDLSKVGIGICTSTVWLRKNARHDLCGANRVTWVFLLF